VADLLVLSLVVSTGHQLQDPANGYEVVAYGPGASNLRRQTVESDDVSGRVLIAWAEDVMLGKVTVRVKGSGLDQVKTRVDTLVGWFRQVDYTLTATVASTQAAGNWTETWTCEPADYEVGDGGMLDEIGLYNRQQLVSFTWPHAPA
jgi:hypothetical protein